MLLAVADTQQADLADALGVSPALVSLTLNGHRRLTAARRRQLVTFLVERILDRSGHDAAVAA